MSDLDLQVNIPKQHLFIILVLAFLISGLVIGYAMGAYNTDRVWREYAELKEKDIESKCFCTEFSTNTSFIPRGR